MIPFVKVEAIEQPESEASEPETKPKKFHIPPVKANPWKVPTFIYYDLLTYVYNHHCMLYCTIFLGGGFVMIFVQCWILIISSSS